MQARQQVAWIDLTRVDNDPQALQRNLFAEIAPILASENFSRVIPIGGEELSLDEQLTAAADPFSVVLDNCDALDSTESIRLLSDLLLSRSNPVRVIAIGRNPTRLQCGALRMIDQVRSIEVSDLAFTEEEIARLLDICGVEASEVLGVHEHSGGWPAGVKLSALAERDAQRQGLGVSARDRLIHSYVDDFVEQNVFLPLCDLHRSAALVATVAPNLVQRFVAGEETDGPVTYREHDVRGLLAPAFDRSGGVELPPILAASLSRISRSYPQHAERAAQRLIAQGEYDTAGELALLTRDQHLIQTIGSRVGRALAIRSDLPRLATFMARLPAELLSSDEQFAYWRLASELLRGQILSQIGLQLDEVLLRFEASDNQLMCGRMRLLSGVRSYFRGDDARARAELESALRELPTNALVERLQAETFLELIAFRLGEDGVAEIHQAKAIGYAFELPIDEVWSWRTTAPNRANAYALRGEIGSAISKYRLILAESPPYALPLEGYLRSRIISLLIERGEFDSALVELDTMQRAVVDAVVEPEWRNELTLAQVRLFSATGRIEEAEQIGNAALPRMRRRREKSQLVLLLARIWLDRGDRALVRSWLDDVRAFDYPAVQVFGEVNYRELELSLKLSEQDFAGAVNLARDLISEAQCKRRVAEEISFSMRLAVALHRLKEPMEADVVAGHAVALAKRGGFLRSLIVPGFDVSALFPDVWKESTIAQRMRQQLVNRSQPVDDHGANGLSRREREILELVALGQSNQQIADGLFISVNTVRNHLVRVNHRLNVSSRLEAVVRARDLKMID
jgi:LuxR family maltose regulon positive regulatory protein